MNKILEFTCKWTSESEDVSGEFKCRVILDEGGNFIGTAVDTTGSNKEERFIWGVYLSGNRISLFMHNPTPMGIPLDFSFKFKDGKYDGMFYPLPMFIEKSGKADLEATELGENPEEEETIRNKTSKYKVVQSF